MAEEKLFQNILLIEDEPAHATLIKRVISPFVQEIAVANSLAAGLAEINKRQPELIITDLHLPDTNGVEHVEKLLEASQHKPVVMLTSSTNIDDAVRAMHLGASDFIVKNFDDHFAEIFRLSITRIKTAQELERERRKLQRDMECLHVAIENGQDAMAVVDNEGRLSYFNSAFSSFVTSYAGDLEDLYSCFGEQLEDNQFLQEMLKTKLNALPKGAVWSSELVVKERRDESYNVTLSIIAREGDVAMGVVWIRDISEIKRRERFQREMLSTTTHDLKGPLGAISLCADMLQDDIEKGGKVEKLVTRIASASQGAINLIDEFLSARRIQEGNYILKPEEQDITLLLHEIYEQHDSIAKARDISLELNSKDNLTGCVDAPSFKRVVANLVSNAIKFTPKGGKVSIGAERTVAGLLVHVEDSGCGMEPSAVQKIFEKYSRLKEHHQVQGTGLGLYVVKSIVNAHGGRIDVTSQVNQGSHFTLYFPDNPPINESGEIVLIDFD